jgi:predicted transcriptional regulator
MEEAMAEPSEKLSLISSITASYLRRNSLGLDQIANLMSSVTKAMQNAEQILSGTAQVNEAVAESADEGRRTPRRVAT